MMQCNTQNRVFYGNVKDDIRYTVRRVLLVFCLALVDPLTIDVDRLCQSMNEHLVSCATHLACH